MKIAFILDNQPYLFETNLIKTIHPFMGKNGKPLNNSAVVFNNNEKIIIPSQAANCLIEIINKQYNKSNLINTIISYLKFNYNLFLPSKIVTKSN